MARGRQAGWSVRYPGAPQGGRCSHAELKSRTERADCRQRNGEARIAEESGRNMVASPHAKTSRRRGRIYSSRQDCRGDIFDQILLLRAHARKFGKRRTAFKLAARYSIGAVCVVLRKRTLRFLIKVLFLCARSLNLRFLDYSFRLPPPRFKRIGKIRSTCLLLLSLV